VSRPINELRGFQKIKFAPHETKTVRFRMIKADFAYYNIDMDYIAEPGEYLVKIGPDSSHLSSISIQIHD
jgi:beta-glucosidase